MRPSLLPVVLFSLIAALPAAAQEAVQAVAAGAQPVPVSVDEQGVIELETMVVTGQQPGPALWKVSKGDHELWILGTLSPLPNGITWLSREVEQVLERTEEVLGPPGVHVGSEIGVFKGLALLPSALKASKNPEGARLQEVLPPDLYARWSVLKAKHMGRDGGVEKKRPILAANELYERALRKSGLGGKPVISPVVDAVVKRRKLKPTSTRVKIMIDDPKAVLKQLSAGGINDQECFRKTLERVENDLPLMVARANAWSIGDLEALRLLPYENQQAACFDALMQTEAAKTQGMQDMPRQMENKWLAAAEVALEKNSVTFATLPVSMLLEPDGVLGKLKARGYEVVEP